MIVVEGMDGSGKSNLVKRISEEFGIPIHDRAATSVGGPRLDLFDWAMRDVDTMTDQEFSVYDRHPLISEYIYGPIVRQHMDDRFVSSEGHGILNKFRHNCLVIYCDPGIVIMAQNGQATADNQMPGVNKHLRQLVWAYRSWYANYSGGVLRWNYKQPTWDELHLSIRAHISDWFGIPDDD